MTSSPRPESERLKLPPISSMDGYLQNRNRVIPPPAPPSPTPPWANSNTSIDDQAIRPQHHRTSLPSSSSSTSSSSSSMLSTSLGNVSINHHPRQLSLPQICTNTSRSIVSPPLSCSLPTTLSTSSAPSSSTQPVSVSPSPSLSFVPSSVGKTASSNNVNHQHERNENERRPSSSHEPSAIKIDKDIQEVIRHCNYLSENMTHQKYLLLDQDYFCDSMRVRPWLDGMIGRANEVLNALLRLRKHQMALQVTRLHGTGRHGDNNDTLISTNDGDDDTLQYDQDDIAGTKSNYYSGKIKGTFHTIRSKKRGRRSEFQGRCHSCNISETPEWRRGPDGARTLCNACGLHYAKLARKKAEQQKEQSKQGKRTTYDILVTDLSMQDFDSMRRPRRTHPHHSKQVSPAPDDNVDDCSSKSSSTDTTIPPLSSAL